MEKVLNDISSFKPYLVVYLCFLTRERMNYEKTLKISYLLFLATLSFKSGIYPQILSRDKE